MATRVLIIGRHILFHDGLTHLLGENPDLMVVGTEKDWERAREVIKRERPDVLIVDHDSAGLGEADLAPLLENEGQNMKVIYLTLAENKMIIHNRQQVADVTASDLLQALKASDSGRDTAVSGHSSET